MSKKKRTAGAGDPLLRDCPSCGVLAGQGCKATTKNGQPLPLKPIASRLVHADRIEPPKKGTHA